MSSGIEESISHTPGLSNLNSGDTSPALMKITAENHKGFNDCIFHLSAVFGLH